MNFLFERKKNVRNNKKKNVTTTNSMIDNGKTDRALLQQQQEQQQPCSKSFLLLPRPSPLLQDNIVRVQTLNHVCDKYEILDEIGKGSMGAVYKVRIKSDKLGGSAFYPKSIAQVNDIKKKDHRFTSFINRMKRRLRRDYTTGREIIDVKHQQQQQQQLVPLSPPPPFTGTSDKETTTTGSNSNRYIYALKTIRLDAINHMVNDESIQMFIEEMINEMQILRSLDHPNIVKAHEVFLTPPHLTHTSTGTSSSSPSSKSHHHQQQQSNTNKKGTNSHANTNTGSTGDDDIHKYQELLQHQHICIVLELCTGGNLHRRAPYNESDAARIIEQILNAVRYMHNRGIVHRDLKYENIMFINNEPDAEIKILDFGLSKKFHNHNGNNNNNDNSNTPNNHVGYMSDQVGTIYTMAPEVIDGRKYTSQADVWSIGVISYMLLSNEKPFNQKHISQMKQLICKGNVQYDLPIWNTMISKTAKDFVQHLLQVNPTKRYTIQQALLHPFITNRTKQLIELPLPQTYQIIENGIYQYMNQTSKLKKLALTVIAHDSISQDIVQLQKAFIQFDTERNGILSYDEFKAALIQYVLHNNNNTTTNTCTTPSYTEDELERIFTSLDLNRNGMIMYTEFLAATIEGCCGQISEDQLAEAFDRLDSDDTGYISEANLREVLGTNCTDDEIKSIIESSDKDHDGQISYNDFLLAFHESVVSAIPSNTTIKHLTSTQASNDIDV